MDCYVLHTFFLFGITGVLYVYEFMIEYKYAMYNIRCVYLFVWFVCSLKSIRNLIDSGFCIRDFCILPGGKTNDGTVRTVKLATSVWVYSCLKWKKIWKNMKYKNLHRLSLPAVSVEKCDECCVICENKVLV